MPRLKWRRFLPKHPKLSPVVSGDIFGTARAILAQLDTKDFETIDRTIEQYKQDFNQNSAAAWLALLILQSPRSAHAQALMDEHPHGYHDREKRLFELIDFNDSFVATVMLLAPEDRIMFAETLREEIDVFCHRVYSKSFSEGQFTAIVHGLSREIAVYLAAEHAGYNVVMTSRVADAFGIDMQIQEPGSGRYINIDCKTSSAFYFRLKDLVHQHRIAPHDMDDAEGKGWWEIVNRGEGKKARIVLLRVSQEDLGEIHDFAFVDDREVNRRIRDIIQKRSSSDGQFGKLFPTKTGESLEKRN